MEDYGAAARLDPLCVDMPGCVVEFQRGWLRSVVFPWRIRHGYCTFTFGGPLARVRLRLGMRYRR